MDSTVAPSRAGVLKNSPSRGQYPSAAITMPTSRTRNPSEATRPETEMSFNFPFTTTTSVLLREQEVTSGASFTLVSGVCVRVCSPFLFALLFMRFACFGQRVLAPRGDPQQTPCSDHPPAPVSAGRSLHLPPQPARAHLRGPSLERTRAGRVRLINTRFCCSRHAQHEHVGETPPGRLSAHVTFWVCSTPQSIKRRSRNSSTGWFMFRCRVINAVCSHVELCSPHRVLVSSSCPHVLLSTRVPAPLQNVGSSHRQERDRPTDITPACPTDGGVSAFAAVSRRPGCC